MNAKINNSFSYQIQLKKEANLLEHQLFLVVPFFLPVLLQQYPNCTKIKFNYSFIKIDFNYLQQLFFVSPLDQLS